MEDRIRYTVLVADDLRLVRDGIARICESSGEFRVTEQCGDGAAALQLLQTRRHDLAVLDVNLPKLFTLEAIRRIRELNVATRILVLSTRGDRKLVLEALRAGASGFLLKTASEDHLLDALHQILAGGVYVSPELELDKIFVPQRRIDVQDPLETLSSREYQVFSLLIDGVRAKEIAARLELSPKTVDTYRASLMRKLDIHDVAGLVKFAIQRELTSVA